jgi:hypothetical protein
MSIWLYVPLTAEDEARLARTEPTDLLSGLVFRSPGPRYVSVGIATDYRLIFEREWRLPENSEQRTLLTDVLEFLNDALAIALNENLPPARRQIVYTASEAIRELAAATA